MSFPDGPVQEMIPSSQKTVSLRAASRSQGLPGFAEVVQWTFSRPTRVVVAQWLSHWSDPLGPRTVAPKHSLSLNEAERLIAEAEAHGVLPIVMRNLQDRWTEPLFASLRADAETRRRVGSAYSMMLRQHSGALLKALAGLPVAIVKGAVFARLLYPTANLRPFTDIDLLVSPKAFDAVVRVLAAQGFNPAEEPLSSDRREWKWVHQTNSILTVEVHTNLVHAPSLQGAMSLTYDHISKLGTETPPSLLAIAVIHGAMHQFERLRYVVDICQAARALKAEDDERSFRELMSRTGGRLAALIGLRLAQQVFQEPRCRQIADGLGSVSHARIARFLVRPGLIMASMNGSRVFHAWRRQAFRELLKRGRLTEPVSRQLVDL